MQAIILNPHSSIDNRQSSIVNRQLNLRRGTAMLEFVLLIPLLATVVALTFFFGWSMMHKTQLLQAARHAPWENIDTGAWPTEEFINEQFFHNRAASVSLASEPDKVSRETSEDLVNDVGGREAAAGALADELTLNLFPPGKRGRVAAGFNTDQPIWKTFEGTITATHQREGLTWRRDDPCDPWNTLRDQYYPDLDNLLNGIPAPGSGMAQMIRGLYLAHW
jgi:hypothetical protein